MGNLSKLRFNNLAALLLLVSIGCSQTASSREHVKGSTATATARTSTPRPALTRKEWLLSARKVALLPQGKLPRVGAVAFERLVRGRAWRSVLPKQVFADKSLLEFFPVIKQLHRRYNAPQYGNEAVELALLDRAFQRAFIVAAVQAIQARTEPEKTKAVRLGGLKKVAIGAAMTDIAMLGRSIHASPSRRSKVLAILETETAYAHYTREALQLFQATLREANRSPNLGKLKKEILKVKLAVKNTLAKLPDSSKVKTTYAALPGAWDCNDQPRRVNSKTGRFSVVVGPGAIVEKTETPLSKGVFRQHTIRRQQGEATFEAMCSDAKAKRVLASIVASGAKKVGQHPKGGTLFFLAKRNAKLRIVARGESVCIAGVEDPRHEVPAADATRFISSLEVAP
jgi:hypothetical protein